MISLESLFSKENDELGLRYSLRIAFLIGSWQEDKRPEVFRLVKKLYKKRSQIVHGTGQIDLENRDISDFRGIISKAIKILIHMNLSKESMLDLLDDAVYIDNKRQELDKVVQEAIKKW